MRAKLHTQDCKCKESHQYSLARGKPNNPTSKFMKKPQKTSFDPRRQPEALLKELDKPLEYFDEDILEPTQHAHNSVFRLCTRITIMQAIRMLKDQSSSSEVARYLYKTHKSIRERYKGISDKNRDKHGIPKTLARSVRLFREKALTLQQRFPDIPSEQLIGYMEAKIDPIREIVILIALQKERISRSHEKERKVGVNDIYIKNELVLLHSLVKTYIMLCKHLGVEIPTNYE